MNYVIVGGGITGLLSAKILRDRHPNASVCILEKENTIGGLLTGISYKENGIYFDTGTHIFQETGNSNIDDILINSIDSDCLIHYPKGKGDLAGLFINGILQKNSYFPDLRNKKISKDILNSVRNHVASGVKIESVDSCKSLLMVANSRFGSRFTDDIITPIFEKVFGLPVKDMSAFALSLTGWTRVILDDFDVWFTNISNESYKSIVAVPDQRKLPVQMHHGRRSFYSKINGSNALINGLRDSLIARNVEIITGADIELINKGDKKIFFKCKSYDKKNICYDKLIISTGIFGAAKLFEISDYLQSFDKPMAHWVIDVILDSPCESDLCYLYGLDEISDWFRITNYNALIDNSVDKRLTIEVLGIDSLDLEYSIQILKQLEEINFLNSYNSDFIKFRKLTSGFPCPSTKNFNRLAELNSKLQYHCDNNILLCGIGTGDGVFYQNQVLLSMYESLNNFDE